MISATGSGRPDRRPGIAGIVAGIRLPKLRAAMSVARLLMQKGGAAKARGVLQPAFDAITEGRDTTDLRAAAAQLTELGSR